MSAHIKNNVRRLRASLTSPLPLRNRLTTALASLLFLLAACDATAPEVVPPPDPPTLPVTRPDYGALRWTSTHGPYGGRITGFALHSEGGLVTSTAFAGFFRSLDGGNRWAALNESLPTRPYQGQDVALVGVAVSEDVLFVATKDNGVYRSEDGGAHWEPASSGVGDPRSAVDLAAGPQGVLLLSTYFGGLYHSTNYGATWHSVGKEITSPYYPDSHVNPSRAEHLAFSPDGTAYASSGTRVFRSDDGGGTWVRVSSAVVGPSVSDVLGLAVAPDGTLLAGTYDGPIRSEDRGETWTEIASLPENSRTFAFHDATWAAASKNEVHLSEDGGKTWISTGAGLEAVSVTALAFDEAGQMFVGTYRRGLWRYDLGKQRWLQVGVPNAAVGSIAQDGSAMYAGSGGGLFRLSGDGSWDQLLEAPVRAVVVGEDGQLLVGKGGYSEGLVRSTDGGQTWTGTSIEASVLLAYEDLLYAGAEPDFNQEGGVYRSEDGGASWTQVASGLERSTVFDLAISKDGTLLAGAGWGLYTLEPGDEQWAALDLDLGPGIYRVWSVAVGPGGALLAGLSGRVIRSTDAGQSWETILEVKGANFMALCVDGRGGLFAGANALAPRNGVYVSADGGDSWSRTIEGLGQRNVLALHATPDGRLYAGTSIYGLFEGSY